jgi:sigma-E factor negative regulatory protein RseB
MVRFVRWLAPLCLTAGLLPFAAAGPVEGRGADSPNDARGWLNRIHAAAHGQNYQGTMVFSTGGVVASSRVAHFCVGDQVFERIEALDGRQRQVYRHNDLVHTVWPDAGLAVVEKRSLQSKLPSATQSVDPRALDLYELRPEGRDRVAGRDAVVFLLQPRDAWRFAQRVWADHETGLMLRADILGAGRDVLESSAFSEVEIGVRAQPESVLQPIRKLETLRVLRPAHVPTQLEAQGWTLATSAPGFRLASCVKRPMNLRQQTDRSASTAEVLQAVFSDGLTHVSLFIEPFDAARHRRDLQAQFGATHSMAGRRGDHWVTAMGDVPPATLKLFFDALERRP